MLLFNPQILYIKMMYLSKFIFVKKKKLKLFMKKENQKIMN
jgi:hypothetical protein